MDGLSATRGDEQQRSLVIGLAILTLTAVAGLYVVKWNPYFHKALTAWTTGRAGTSVLDPSSAPSLHGMLSYAQSYFSSVWQAMLLGLVLAATIESLLPSGWLARSMAGRGLRVPVAGTAASLPGMMCTCCTAPVARGLRRAGASIGNAVAFFLGNPTLNPAVLVFLLFTLGWKWAVLRLLVGLPLVLGSALLAESVAGGGTVSSLTATRDAAPPATAWDAVRRWIRSFTGLAVRLVPEYIIVILVLGAAQSSLVALLNPGSGTSVLAVLALAVVGALFAIPTAGEIPIIQGMLLSGIGSVPAAALLLTLAPVSLPSLLMLRRVFPWKVLALLLGTTVLSGVLAAALASVWM